ncbi:cysteine--tRNA ligase [Nonomuraea muscovyensis]|uniref:cysteine--tRNA ligase n=1 Tax=Nonomuraea muscovyensis TaxID=1124761 RepID=UPI0033CF4925|nr:cysteine--tRNA ligase [Nonomuraea muscovyensis]
MLRIHDALTGRSGELAPGRAVRMHTCGPVAGPRPAHLGDLRPHVLSDVVRRLLESRRVRVLACRGPLLDGDPAALGAFRRAAGALNLRPPEHEPLAGEAVEAAVELIAGLVERGEAHVTAGGSVLLGTGSAPADGGAGSSASPGGGADGGDAGRVLWAATSGGPAWDSPWGRGVPAPDVRCQAVARRLLGARVDILVADGNACSHHDGPLLGAGHRLASGPVLFDGPELLPEQVTEAGLDPLAVRLAYLEHHYREPVRLTWDLLREADGTVRRWRARVAGWAESPSAPLASGHVRRVEEALDDDLDTPAALGALRDLEGDDSVAAGAKFESFLHLDQVLALDLAMEIGRSPAP